MIALLKMCGFEAQEIDSELPRIEKTFKKLGITKEDIERGKQRLTKYYDVELNGVRKLLRLWIRELANLTLAREEGKTKIIYGFMAPKVEILFTTLVSKSKEVYATNPCAIHQFVLGHIFGKMVPILEAAENKWLKSGAFAHCGNVKSIVGLFALDLIPRPDLLITSDSLCETAPKTIDLLHELYDIPTACLVACLDEKSGKNQYEKRHVDLVAKSFRELVERTQEVVGFEITDDMLQGTIDAQDRLNAAAKKLRDLIESSDPIPISSALDHFWGDVVLGIVDEMPATIDAINTLYEELQERVNNGVGVVEKGAPRILTYTPPHFTDPRPEHLMAQLGIATVGTLMGMATVGTFFSSAITDSPPSPISKTAVKDPYETMAISMLAMGPHFVGQRIPVYEGQCKRLKVNGVLDRFHTPCRSIMGDALIIQDELTKELGTPVLLLEWEDFDPRVYNHNQCKTTLETFKSMLIKSSR